MRFTALAVVVGVALATTIAPAQAQWKTYISRDFGFSFAAPGEVRVERSTSSVWGGARPAVVFRSVANNMEYKVIVANFDAEVGDGVNILLRTAYRFQLDQKVLMDIYASIENSEESSMEADAAGVPFVPQRPERERGIYGRKITIVLPDKGGRSTAAFYFHKGNLIQAQATVLPAHGDDLTPDVGRFIDSVAFRIRHIPRDATDLRLPDNWDAMPR